MSNIEQFPEQRGTGRAPFLSLDGQTYLLVPMTAREAMDIECWADEHFESPGELAARTLLDEVHR